jgi:dTDP-4-dehydrorhamnose reductase
MTRILLLGRTGQVGWELNRALLPLGEVVALSRAEADFSRPESLRQIVRNAGAQIIVNAVAYTAVDKAESEELVAHLVNADAPAVLSEEATRSNAMLVHYSTDYVFDGTKPEPYAEDDKPNPINAYGRTKLAGEQNIRNSGCKHLIFRTSWVYSSRGQNFVKTILRLAQQRDELRIVADQIGAPTSARFIADVTSQTLGKIQPIGSLGTDVASGTFHLTPLNSTSWYGFANALLEAEKSSLRSSIKLPKLIPITTAEYPLPAPRPRNSRLNCDKLRTQFGINLPHWEVNVQLCLNEITERGGGD